MGGLKIKSRSEINVSSVEITNIPKIINNTIKITLMYNSLLQCIYLVLTNEVANGCPVVYYLVLQHSNRCVICVCTDIR